MGLGNVQNRSKDVHNRFENVQNQPKNVEISKKCVGSYQNPTHNKKRLLLVPKPTGHLVPRCRNNLQLCFPYLYLGNIVD